MPPTRPGYVRYRSRYASVTGLKIGVFGLVNTMAKRGMLSPAEERFRRENNDWYDAAYPSPGVYDADAHPLAAAWFKDGAVDLLGRLDGYLAILDTHAIAWERVRTTDPGAIIYEDAWQVIAIPPGAGGP